MIYSLCTTDDYVYTATIVKSICNMQSTQQYCRAAPYAELTNKIEHSYCK